MQNQNVSRRPRRSDESFHRDKRRKNVDRLAILESRVSDRRRPSALRIVVSALTGFLRRGRP